MRKVVYYLSTCDTCKKIMKPLSLGDFEKINIKENPLNQSQLLELYAITESYEALFNKRARKYRALDLKEKVLDENDYKSLILADYTFLKRPVFLMNGEIFVGNDKNTVEKLNRLLG